MTTSGKAPVGYDDLRGYLELLERQGLLQHVSAQVDWDSELGAIAYR